MAQQPKRRISAKAIRDDLRSGMNDESIREKHRLSERELHVVFKKLTKAGVISQADLDKRVPVAGDETAEKVADASVSPGPEPVAVSEQQREEPPQIEPHAPSKNVRNNEIIGKQAPSQRISRAILILACIMGLVAAAAIILQFQYPDLIGDLFPFLEAQTPEVTAPAVKRKKTLFSPREKPGLPAQPRPTKTAQP
jgi:hypothetical protein